MAKGPIPQGDARGHCCDDPRAAHLRRSRHQVRKRHSSSGRPVTKIYPVILSGGSGTRLWPLSREKLPKQFLPISVGPTLFQQTALRVSDPLLFEPIQVIANAQHRFLAAQQFQEIGLSRPTIVLEPSARGTAAAAAVAALMVSRLDPDGLMLLMPVDHRISDVDAFLSAIRIGAETALRGFISLFGVKPDHAATGYGYIRVGEELYFSKDARQVLAFSEKPDREIAQTYLESGEYLWNSGIFLLPVSTFLAELTRYEPALLRDAREALDQATRDADFVRLDAGAFEKCQTISIDHAIMERSDRTAVIPVDFDWSDVGSWSSVASLAERDNLGNTTVGEVLIKHTLGSYVRSEGGPLIATLGVENLVIIATADAILVAHKNHLQEVKGIVDRLRDGNHGRT